MEQGLLCAEVTVAGGGQDEVQEPNADFKPNLVNTVCFLVQFIIQLITFGVNYQGPPFNASIRDTTALRYTFWWGSIFWAVLSLDLVPELTKLVSLVRSFLDLPQAPPTPLNCSVPTRPGM